MDSVDSSTSQGDDSSPESSSTPKIPNKPKRRSLVERELETSLTARITSPVTNGEIVGSTSRYGRSRRLKTNSDFCDTDKAVTLAIKTENDKSLNQAKSPANKMLPSNIKTPVTPELESLKEPKTNENEVSPFSAKKNLKVYTRKDMIQSKGKEETASLLLNMFSPTKQHKTSTHLNNILERSLEKYALDTFDVKKTPETPSVVKTLDFDSGKKKKKEDNKVEVLSKSKLFDIEANCEYQVGDLAWSRIGTYPFWPCIVTREPSTDMFVRKKLFGKVERDVIHVTFFGDNGSRSWIVDNMLRKYQGLQEFQAAKEKFTPEAKRKDPRLYAAFFISEKKLEVWNKSVEEAETLLREPKRLRIDLLNEMIISSRGSKTTPKRTKNLRVSRTDSDVSLSESLYDTLFSEDDSKVEDPDKKAKQRKKSLDVSEVVTACLDNMAAKTGMTKIQRQSHMDRWLQKAKSKTPEKLQSQMITPNKTVTIDTKNSSSKTKQVSFNSRKQNKAYSLRSVLDVGVDSKQIKDEPASSENGDTNHSPITNGDVHMGTEIDAQKPSDEDSEVNKEKTETKLGIEENGHLTTNNGMNDDQNEESVSHTDVSNIKVNKTVDEIDCNAINTLINSCDIKLVGYQSKSIESENTSKKHSVIQLIKITQIEETNESNNVSQSTLSNHFKDSKSKTEEVLIVTKTVEPVLQNGLDITMCGKIICVDKESDNNAIINKEVSLTNKLDDVELLNAKDNKIIESKLLNGHVESKEQIKIMDISETKQVVEQPILAKQGKGLKTYKNRSRRNSMPESKGQKYLVVVANKLQDISSYKMYNGEELIDSKCEDVDVDKTKSCPSISNEKETVKCLVENMEIECQGIEIQINELKDAVTDLGSSNVEKGEELLLNDKTEGDNSEVTEIANLPKSDITNNGVLNDDIELENSETNEKSEMLLNETAGQLTNETHLNTESQIVDESVSTEINSCQTNEDVDDKTELESKASAEINSELETLPQESTSTQSNLITSNENDLDNILDEEHLEKPTHEVDEHKKLDDLVTEIDNNTLIENTETQNSNLNVERKLVEPFENQLDTEDDINNVPVNSDLFHNEINIVNGEPLQNHVKSTKDEITSIGNQFIETNPSSNERLTINQEINKDTELEITSNIESDQRPSITDEIKPILTKELDNSTINQEINKDINLQETYNNTDKIIINGDETLKDLIDQPIEDLPSTSDSDTNSNTEETVQSSLIHENGHKETLTSNEKIESTEVQTNIEENQGVQNNVLEKKPICNGIKEETSESTPEEPPKDQDLKSETASIASSIEDNIPIAKISKKFKGKETNEKTTKMKRRGRPKLEDKQDVNEIKINDPEFQMYLELRQDALLDENPHLTEEEITVYLYKTWTYEQNLKSDTVKNDDLIQATLVKGSGEDNQPAKKVKKKIKSEKQTKLYFESKISYSDVASKDKPKRKIIKAYYNEDESDFEDELEVFEIFKKIPKMAAKPQSSKADIVDDKTESTEEIATIEETEIEGEQEEKIDEVESYFKQLTEPKPNLFKGLIRERVCDICERPGNLVKCKGPCSGMFHVDCVKKEMKQIAEANSQASVGRKKKKKPRGRKPKNLDDSGSHSDDKTDALDDSQMSIDELPSNLVIEAEKLEKELEVKMKEILGKENKENDEYYSSDEELRWENTVEGRCEIITVKLRPKQSEMYANFKCNNCQKSDTPLCFVCKSQTSPKNNTELRQKCNVAHCNKYYHIDCLDHWPQTQFNAGELSKKNKEHLEAMSCPRHVCHTCVCDDPRGCKTRFSGDKLARCVRCPATYHSFTKCLPAGTTILNGSNIICPRHYEHRPGKVPCHVNTGWCFICALGGTLICCEYCPTSFHAECLNIKPPEGNYMCEDCETGRLPLYGEMVWVKLGHYRWWPGIILHPSEVPENIMAVKHSQGEFVVRFFGQYDYYWVNRGRVFPFQEGDTGRVSAQKSKIDEAFTVAMDDARRACEILKSQESNVEEDVDIASSLLPPHYVKLRTNRAVGAVVAPRPDECPSLCGCDPDGPSPCAPDSDCLNRMLLIECGPSCRAGDRCLNRAFERRLYPRLEPHRTRARGWGLRTKDFIRQGQFVIEYVGELIDEEEFRRRMNRKHEIRDENFYFLTLDKDRMIDAGPKGNLARFMNHCCEPNCETQKWTVLGDVRVGLFALTDIPPNSEVTFNYNLECAGIDKKRCMCGAKRCSGYIGAKPKQEETQPKKTKPLTKRPYKKKKQPVETLTLVKSSPKPRTTQRSRPKELTEIEKDLLIIKNATNGISSDSECSGRLSSIDKETEKVSKALKRKRVSFSTEETIMYSDTSSPSIKRVKIDEENGISEVGD